MKNYAQAGFLPVLDEQNAQAAAAVLQKANVGAAELRWAGESTAQTLAALYEGYPQMLFGVFDVQTVEDCELALASHAAFVVLRGFLPEVYTAQLHENVILSCGSFQEIEKACSLGADTICLKPAYGREGQQMLKGLFAAHPELRVMVRGTGEAELENFIICPATLCVEAEWIFADGDLLAAEERCARAHQAVMGFSLAHVGINCANEAVCQEVSGEFARLFGFSRRDNGNSVYASDAIEVMKFMQVGNRGHLGIHSNSTERALMELEKKGMRPIREKMKYRDGRLNVVYFENEIGGFGLHLIQRNPD